MIWCNLPEPGKDLEWKPVTSFSVADEPIKDPGLKDVFKTAISNGQQGDLRR